MDRIDQHFAAVSRKMRRLTLPDPAMPAPQPITSLIDKVNAAKRFYQPSSLRSG